MPPRLREPVITPRFERDLERLSGDINRLNELVEAVVEVLCRKPEAGKDTAKEAVFGFPLMRLPGNPGCVRYFSYTSTQVILHYLVSEKDFPADSIM